MKTPKNQPKLIVSAVFCHFICVCLQFFVEFLTPCPRCEREPPKDYVGPPSYTLDVLKVRPAGPARRKKVRDALDGLRDVAKKYAGKKISRQPATQT